MKRFWEKVSTTDIRHIISIITVIGGFILLYLLQVKAIPVENKDVLNITIGFVFGGGFNSVYSYFFGSSKKDSVDNTKN